MTSREVDSPALNAAAKEPYPAIPLPSPARTASRPPTTQGILTTSLLFIVGGLLSIATYGTPLAMVFPVLLAVPIFFVLVLRRERFPAAAAIFARSFAVGVLAAGIAAYYAIVLRDPYQLASDASSFFELSSRAGPARSLQDLQTITEGAGAVVLWRWFYDISAAIGFPREPYIGVSINVILVASTAVICAASARLLYGEDEYRTGRLLLFFTISGNMWLFAGIHIRDASILFIVMLLCHFWIAYLAQLQHRRVAVAAIATLLAMPLLEVLRAEFFYVPLLIGSVALASLNFSRGRGDNRFISLVSLVFGLVLAATAMIAFGDQIQAMFLTGREGYSDLSLAEARSGSLGTALIVEQPTLIRIALGVPYLYFFPIPFWIGALDPTVIMLFKSLNAVSFYFISAFLFAGAYMIVTNGRLRSPAFLFALGVPLTFSVSIALTSLETRHLGVFLPLFFLVSLMPDFRVLEQRRLLRVTFTLIALMMVFIHATWAVLRYA